MVELKELFTWSALVAGVTLLISKILNMVSVPTANITLASLDINVRQRLVSGLDTGIGSKIWGYVSGIIPLDGSGIILVLITSVVIVALGGLIAKTVKIKGSDVQRSAWSLTLGALVAGILVTASAPTLTLNFFASVITLWIYFAIVSYGAIAIGNYFKIKPVI